MTNEGRDLPNGKRLGDEPAPLDDAEILEDPRHGGIPGDEAGRRVAAGGGGVFPASAGWPEGDMDLRREGGTLGDPTSDAEAHVPAEDGD